MNRLMEFAIDKLLEQVDNKEPTPTILEFSTTPEFTISDIKPDNYHE